MFCKFPEQSVRFIPAYVGNTSQCTDQIWNRTVHPRVCGEHDNKSGDQAAFQGSSPRMWGTPAFSAARALTIRFIPAYVGNTCQPCARAISRPVHPRVCGEHLLHFQSINHPLGSSPRMWGTRKRAGPVYSISTVHPRVCGEHSTHSSPSR